MKKFDADLEYLKDDSRKDSQIFGTWLTLSKRTLGPEDIIAMRLADLIIRIYNRALNFIMFQYLDTSHPKTEKAAEILNRLTERPKVKA